MKGGVWKRGWTTFELHYLRPWYEDRLDSREYRRRLTECATWEDDTFKFPVSAINSHIPTRMEARIIYTRNEQWISGNDNIRTMGVARNQLWLLTVSPVNDLQWKP